MILSKDFSIAEIENMSLDEYELVKELYINIKKELSEQRKNIR